MSIYIRESLSGEGFYVECNYKSQMKLKESAVNIDDPIDSSSIMVDIEAIHEYPFSTRNYTRYMKEFLSGFTNTWTKPYQRPVIMHHNEENGKIIGRIKAVNYKTTGTLSGTPAQIFTVNIGDKEGKEGVQNGTLKTTSIGLIGHDVRCSICGTNMAELSEKEIEMHEHQRGEVYNGEICYWDIYSGEGKEISYVVVPSDIYSQNIKIYKPQKGSNNITESYKKGVNTKMADIKENAEIEEEVKKEQEKTESTKNNDDNNSNNNADDVEAIKAENIKLKAQLVKEQEKTQDVIDKLKSLTGTVDELKAQAKSATDALTLKSADLIKEQQLRESLENDLKGANLKIREGLENTFITLRESLGKEPVSAEDLKLRNDISLADSIKDLREEFKLKKHIPIVEHAENKSVVDDIDTNKDTKKEKSGAVNLTEMFETVIKSAMNKF